MSTLPSSEPPDQISAESILKDIYAKRTQLKIKSTTTPKVDILDLEELKEFQRRKRTEFETYLKRNRLDMGQWIRYGQFEIEQHDWKRARSVYERALLVDSSYIPLWIRYIDNELKNKFINHARNLLNRAITILPRVDKLWYKYLFVEESLQNWDIVRALFRKWCLLEPKSNAWDSFIQFEIRQENWENVRDVFSQYVLVHPQIDTWLQWVKFETVHGDIDTIRSVYSLALDTLISFEDRNTSSPVLHDDIIDLIISFANWEATQLELERVRALYNISLDKWPEEKKLQDGLVDFEKKHGNTSTMEESIIGKRKREYETYLLKNPQDYDTWWLYFDLLQDNFPHDILIHAYDKFLVGFTQFKPKDGTKTIKWQRYIYLWIRYLIFLELETDDIEKCRTYYKMLINEVIPNKNFTFGKIWILYSEFEIRHNGLTEARKILGRSIGMVPKDKLFMKYIEIEMNLKEFDRVRKLYEKYLQFNPGNLNTWISYIELEASLGDDERVRALYNIILEEDNKNFISNFLPNESRLQMMKKFIDFETEEQEYDNARELYEKYLKLSDYSPEIWISFAMYQNSTPTKEQLQDIRERLENEEENGSDEEQEIEFEISEVNKENARSVFEKAIEFYKTQHDTKRRILMLEAFQGYEETYGTEETKERLLKRMPQVVKKRIIEDDTEKEVIDYIFPDDVKLNKNASKFLELAKKWSETQK
ncbi:Clf1p NDAI_0G02660 [Naumovozyma dairenensis CBS 421]|uniref:Pre-mRNA-splicing factor CLF1 n=1 Tax=Naumovozyma dairenensis (strain ATCC 10597 / BCRC 20456 / CBS 421 / NBRC 0211 / NRRL Y-12639) TaxID=1071378 RepID=G0WE32_NAUDC|nr:hypothetical protein NDAI_0G02660 [Naumovozyma dairenensis CBS 421]CCD26043.2 hypothetical protein NDAI_0G02660 [Naumovozyma dairenensis CBS 421]